MNYALIECDNEFLDIIEVHYEDGTVKQAVEIEEKYLRELLDREEYWINEYLEDAKLYNMDMEIAKRNANNINELFYYFVRGEIRKD